MMMVWIALSTPVVFALGWMLQWIFSVQRKAKQLQNDLLAAHTRIHQLELECTRSHEENRARLEAEQRMEQAFKALSQDALQQNNEAFLSLAKSNLEQFQQQARSDLSQRQEAISHLVHPVRESLAKFETKFTELEKARAEGVASLKSHLGSLASMHADLSRETARLSNSLKATSVRGRWGEIQLRRVVELAGMVAHCDFYEQQTSTHEGQRRRPDLVVRLPTDRVIVVDAKAPLDAYLEANETESEERRLAHLQRHANQIRAHIRELANKNYTEFFKPSPEFVVLFLPGEIFFSAALSQDPTLIEVGAEQGVVLATPTTLISLLRAVSFGWRQEAISRNAEQVRVLGAELYKRLCTLTGHWSKVGRQLSSAVQSYNDAVGSLERRVLVTAREFEQLGALKGNSELVLPTPIDQTPRNIKTTPPN